MNSSGSKYDIIDIVQWATLLGLILGRYIEAIVVFVVALLLLAHNKKIYRSTSKVFVGLLIMFIVSIATILYNNYTTSKFFQQFILVFIISLSYSQILNYTRKRIPDLFEKYIKIMYLVSILGIIQFVICYLFVIDIFRFLPEGHATMAPGNRIMRIHSVLTEAGNLGTSLLPIIAYLLLKPQYFFANKFKSCIIIITFLLTFATIAYSLLILIILYKLIQKYPYCKPIAIGLIVLFGYFSIKGNFSQYSSSNISTKDLFASMAMKITESSRSFGAKSAYSLENLNLSTYAIQSNLWVALNAPNRWTGTGLGTHQENYHKLYKETSYAYYGLNSDDAYSLFTRVFSEFGYLGLILIFVFLIRYYNKDNLINICSFFILIALLIRGGHYTMYGTVMFIFLYYFTSQKVINDTRTKKIKNWI